METNQKTKDVVSFFLSNNILISEKLLKEINQHSKEIRQHIQDPDKSKKLIDIINNKGSIETILKNTKTPVDVLFSYDKNPQKKSIQDFIHFFNARYETLEKMLCDRKELVGLTQISRAVLKKERITTSIIGLVSEIHETKNGNIFLTIEDQTGSIRVLVNKNKPELFKLAKQIVLDECVGINGVSADGILFVNSIIQPDIPSPKVKQSPDEVYAIFLSDLHIGSTYFLEEKFSKFIKWIRGEMGNDTQKELVSKIKYIFLVGDLIDGVGIYPGQEKELKLKSVHKQYALCAKYLSQIPKDKQIIICPGNHDALRIAEPQPPLIKEYTQTIYDLPNTTIVSNPSLVNIHKTENFPGFNVLLYHGYSFDYYISNVDDIRNNGGYDRADLVMKFLLKRRHLAPAHTSNLYIPEEELDPLIIAPTKEFLPDIFATGHIHKACISKYKDITLICGSCWQSTTPFQVKIGHHPEPARIPTMNLQTGHTKMIRF